MKKNIVLPILIGTITFGAWWGISQFGTETFTHGLIPDAPLFAEQWAESEPDELTIASFNVRNVHGSKRTLDDFQELADIIDDADIVVFQELSGVGIYGAKERTMERYKAMAAAYKIYLGDEWEFVFASSPTPTPEELASPSELTVDQLRASGELPCLAYRTKTKNYTINVNWVNYFDLGPRRDMGLFEVTCQKGSKTETFTIGSVHTKPDSPERGKELLAVADYIDEHENDKFIILGDFNWGYKSSGPNKYEGEERIMAQHNEGKVLQLFHEISILGGSTDSNDFRTNLNTRKEGFMYDQFLICKAYAGKLSSSGSLGADCGFYSLSENSHFKMIYDAEVENLLKGYKLVLKREGIVLSSEEGKAKLKEMKEYIKMEAPPNEAPTFRMSDHKPIWMKLKIF